MRDKVKSGQQVEPEDQIDSYKLNYVEFEDLMFRIAIIAKAKLNEGVPKNRDSGGDTQRSTVIK